MYMMLSLQRALVMLVVLLVDHKVIMYVLKRQMAKMILLLPDMLQYSQKVVILDFKGKLWYAFVRWGFMVTCRI